MGRWAQRRRGGGDPKSVQGALLQIEDANITSTTEVTAEYSGEISAAGFSDGDFTSLNSNETSISVTQFSANELVIEFSGTITGDDQIEYTGTKPGVLTPQTVNY